MPSMTQEHGSSEAVYDSHAAIGPLAGEPYVLTLDGNVQEIDLEAEFKNLKRIFTFQTDSGDIHWAFSNQSLGEGATLNEAATGKTAGTCLFLPEGQRADYYPKGRYLLVKGPAAALLRIAPTSPGQGK